MPAYTHEVVEENEYLPARFHLVRCLAYTVPAHWHEYLEILYLVDGRLDAVIQAEAYRLSPGEMMVINANELHMTQTSGKTTYILLQISSKQLRQFFHDFDSLHFRTLISNDFQNDISKKVFCIIMQMLEEYQHQEDGYQLLFAARLYELLFYLYKHYSSHSFSKKPGFAGRDFLRITKIMEWMRQEFREPLTLNEAAASIGVSREYFCRLFKKYTGQTFKEYLNAVRTMHFYEDLKQKDDSITLLMEKNGITNYKVFMRTFKKLYGNTPQNIRKSGI